MRIIQFVPGDRPMPDAGEMIFGADYLGVITDDEFPQTQESKMRLFLRLDVAVMAAALVLPLAACDADKTAENIEKFQNYAKQACSIIPVATAVAPLIDAVAGTGGGAVITAAVIKQAADKFCNEAEAQASMRTLVDQSRVQTEKGPVEVYRLRE